MAGSTPDSLRLSWTVAQGTFDSFLVQYKDAQGQPQAVPVAGDENEVTIPGLKSDRKYKMNLYGLHGRRRVGPMSVVATTGEFLPCQPTSSEQDLGTWPRASTLPAPSFSALILPKPPPSSPYPRTSHVATSSTETFTALLLHLQKQAHLPIPSPWNYPSTLLSSPQVCSATVLSLWFSLGLCPFRDLAQAMVMSKLLSPAAHTLMPLPLYSELTDPRDKNTTFPQPLSSRKGTPPSLPTP